MPSTSSPRLDYLDAVRAFALLLGIAFHASLSFTPVYFGWAVMDISTSNSVSIFMLISHSFRMALFFLIAGFFAHMSLQKGGAHTLLKNRLLRIGLPLILGWLILRPLLVSGWVMGADSLRGNVDITKGLVAGFTSMQQLPTGFLTGSHLWFLYYLLLFTITSLVLHFTAKYLGKYWSAPRNWQNAFSWFSASRFSTALLTIPTAGCLWFMDHWGINTPDKSLIPELPVLLLYGGFFFFGWRLQYNVTSLENFAAITGEKIFTCIVSILCCIVLSPQETQSVQHYYPLIKAVYLLSYASMMWSLVALCIGLFKAIFNKANRLMRYLADASYWLYLVHLPIVIWLQVAVAELHLHWAAKWVLVTTVTLAISLLFYDVFVRSTVIGQVLNGRKMPRVLFNVRANCIHSNKHTLKT